MNKKNIITLAIISLMSVSLSAQNIVQVKGSDTMVNLVQKLAEACMEKTPNMAVAVTGGGSGVGIAALAANQVPIADASRAMNAKEYLVAKENGVVPVEVAIAIDGLCVVVSDAVGIKSLSMPQLGAIFRGDVRNWSEVGGPNLPISLYGRQASSGTYVFFQEHVMGNKNYSPKMKQMNGNAQIIEGIRAEKGGIGYVGVGYVYDDKGNIMQGIHVLDVSKDLKSKPVSPLNADNVKSNLYPISRPLFQYINGKPKGDVKAFVAFELGPEGQKIVEEMGFYSLSQKYIEMNKKAGL